MKADGVSSMDPQVCLRDVFTLRAELTNHQDVGTVPDQQFILVFAKGF